jgi:hypothetical protein
VLTPPALYSMRYPEFLFRHWAKGRVPAKVHSFIHGVIDGKQQLD